MNATEAIKGLAYTEGFLTAMAAVLQDREYVEKGHIGNITATTAEVHRMLRNVATHIGCDENEIKGLKEENERLKDASKPVCAEAPMTDKPFTED